MEYPETNLCGSKFGLETKMDMQRQDMELNRGLVVHSAMEVPLRY